MTSRRSTLPVKASFLGAFHLPDVEMNVSRIEPVRMALVCSTQEAIGANLPFREGWELRSL